MIDIRNVNIIENPCYVGQKITLSVDIHYEQDKYHVPTYYKILTSEYEKSVCTIGDNENNYVRIADEKNNILLDESGNILVY